jgi:hypothetical protein
MKKFLFSLAVLAMASFAQADQIAIYSCTETGTFSSTGSPTSLLVRPYQTSGRYVFNSWIIRNLTLKSEVEIYLSVDGRNKYYDVEVATTGNLNTTVTRPYDVGLYYQRVSNSSNFMQFEVDAFANLVASAEAPDVGGYAVSVKGMANPVLLAKSQMYLLTPLVLSGNGYDWNIFKYTTTGSVPFETREIDHSAFARTYRLSVSFSDQANSGLPLTVGQAVYNPGTVGYGVYQTIIRLQGQGYDLVP